MAINLQKGQRINLTKGGQTLSKLTVGLGWDPISKSRKSGFLSSIFGVKQSEIDCDASVLMLNEDYKLENNNVVYFGNLRSRCESVIHTGDNLTGEGNGDDEVIYVTLDKVPSNIHKLVFAVNIYDCINRRQDFGMIKNAYIRVVNSSNNEELVRYNLTDDYSGKTTVIVGEIYRNGSEWKFAAIGEGTNDTNLNLISRRYR
ncbi:stress response protein SCP2 [Clostridium acetobutylicum]|uniref:TerE family protein, ortholog of stress responce protein SCP2 (YCEC) B.subtilis n=1 Tax=Clostridium acetobutylicum (strain ATCC 824 / DSM 792 / JCM 1419 / IAM 19013 / LMG 5710 / NBRC 13948 / NRRL B-527 / VKM B-1787 / 2291 / W) TaxID=272562 RepID=Q97J72_CLOAB|nr:MULTISPECIES: TerD family protein [Clostridium]AAK79382.1 TerE family protein, ortholog of stress responce protein SCP2 (YCEC) B.subtilis [Clostridium acetobutylicum ATCC 824]ADZ20467.1 TerE family protein [Clostridium acetobutylicum EA 2018]AEI33680.1 stress response protein [Clostridium acetobutylicum DSM 1731]AWV81369.1 TerD family protein [Clostridium acetobutylicum]MBC2393003.1 TerD family protein [Clostridium acetobutylicum]